MVVISTRVPAELLEVVDAAAVALGRTRSAVLRALVEDMADLGELPDVAPTRQEQLDAELEHLRALSRGSESFARERTLLASERSSSMRHWRGGSSL